MSKEKHIPTVLYDLEKMPDNLRTVRDRNGKARRSEFRDMTCLVP